MAGDYEKLHVLGSGTYGKAWLAIVKSNQKQCVLKEIKVSDMTKKEIDQTITEVTVLARCKHENIIRYTGAYVDSGSLFIAMEYAEAGDISKKILDQRGIHFAESVILAWFVQINMALCYIHSHHILHRDLKPQNIFLTSENMIKLGDFGIARVLRDKHDLAMTVIGTPYYLSPEICQKQPYNHKSDMWALGCVLYELCCLRVPFSAPDFTSLVMIILSGSFDPIPRHYGPLLEDLVGVLLRTQPDSRPTSEQILCIPAMQPYVLEYTANLNRAICEKKRRLTSPNIDTLNVAKKEKREDYSSKKMEGKNICKDIEKEEEMKDVEDITEKSDKAVVPLDENQNEVKGETIVEKKAVCCQSKEENQDGCATPVTNEEMNNGVENTEHKTPPRSKTPENCCAVADCYCVENPKKKRIEHVSPHMKDIVNKQRAAFSCEPGMKLNVGNQGIGPAPIFSLFSSVRRPIRSESGQVAIPRNKPRPFSMAHELMARKSVVGRSKSATRLSSSDGKLTKAKNVTSLRKLSKSVDDLSTNPDTQKLVVNDITDKGDNSMELSPDVKSQGKSPDDVFKSPGKPIDPCFKTPNRKVSSHTDVRSVTMSLGSCSSSDSNFKTPKSKTSPTNMNDSGCSEDDVFAPGMLGKDPTAITPAAGSQGSSGSCINSATFRVPHDKPRLSVPIVDMRDECELNDQNIKVLYQATLESTHCKNRALTTLTLYLQEKLGAPFFQHLYALFKEAVSARTEFEILKSRMRKSSVYLPLFIEIMRIENHLPIVNR